jgi:predicted O-linked N-acetylglucosamine transferase (SPINDLY family)
MSDPLDGAQAALLAGRPGDALSLAEVAAAQSPSDLRAARLIATIRTTLGHRDAERAWTRVLELAQDDPEAHYALGQIAGDHGDFAAAAEHFRRALVRAPGHPQLMASLGLALEESGRWQDAEAQYRHALAATRDPPYLPLANLARILFRQRRYADALSVFDELSRKFGIAQASLNAAYGACLANARRVDEAQAAFERALVQEPQAPGVARDYAAFLMRRGRHDDAVRVLEHAGAATGDDLLAASMLLACRVHLADWHDFDALRNRVIARVAAGLADASDVVPAYDFVGVCDDPALQRVAAQSWAYGEAPEIAPPARRAQARPGKLRLGFVSSDYGNHPVGRLIVGLFERLDRSRFEVLAYSTAASAHDAFRARIEAAVDRHRSLDRSDPDIAARAIAADAIDVLFDLNGFSGGEAIRIFARRPAPVQINFLGYTGTSGSTAYDYVVADRYCVPPARQDAFAERLLYIDPCYLPSDPARTLHRPALTRADYALPAEAFVFCAFAAVYKILPDMFACWMKLLSAIPGSVLWLRHMQDDRIARLRREAARRGVDGGRLIVAPGERIERYLVRFALADLFLDSAPFGSHTTVNDALFAGLPVMTIAGRSFAGRASASQLDAIGLPELIAADAESYASLARALATDRARLADITSRLRAKTPSSPLFDMDAYARTFEGAVVREYETTTGF